MTLESAALREKRLELEELEKGKDFCDPALYGAMHQALQDDLAELGAAPAPIRLTTPIRPKPAVAVQVAESHPTEVLLAQPVEKKTMPKTPPTTKTDPKDVLDHLLGRLATAAARGSKLDSIRWEIRTHCRLTGLTVPKEAEKLPMGRHAAPKAADTQVVVSNVVLTAPQAPVSNTSAACRIRALRSLALEILPQLEDLDQVAAAEVNAEMSLLSETFVLASHLVSRRTA